MTEKFYEGIPHHSVLCRIKMIVYHENKVIVKHPEIRAASFKRIFLFLLLLYFDD